MQMKKYSILMTATILVSLFAGCSGTNAKYDIEKAFPDETFVQIIEGEKVPSEFKHGVGGEQGYLQYPTKDPELIKKYIEAFKEFKIKETVKDKDAFVQVADGVNDYIFCLEDGKEILLSIDANTYITDKEVQYVLEHNEKLYQLNQENDVLSDETILEAVKKYCYSNNPDLEKIEKEGEYPVSWEVASSDDNETAVLFRSYTGARITYYIDRHSGLTTKVTEEVPGITDEPEESDENFKVQDYL